MITFIIPVKHYKNAKNWDLVKQNLKDTINSVNAQTDNNWKCIIVANQGSELPLLPKNFEVCWVNFDPNPNYNLQKDNDLPPMNGTVEK